jgi:hypothetical protein
MEICPKGIDFEGFSAVNREMSLAQRNFAAFAGRVKAGGGHCDLVWPPGLRYISRSVGGV